MNLDDVDAFAKSLPDVTVGARWGTRTWLVGDKGFAWERPFSKADLGRFGEETPPAGEILAVRTDGLDGKEALLAMELAGFFTIPHFNGHPGILIELRRARAKDVKAAIRDAHAVIASSRSRRASKSSASSRGSKRPLSRRRARA